MAKESCSCIQLIVYRFFISHSSSDILHVLFIVISGWRWISEGGPFCYHAKPRRFCLL